MSLRLCEIPSTELASIFPLIKHQNPKITKKRFSSLLTSMVERGYRCLGAYEGASLIGICGFSIGHRFWCGKQMDLDNFIVDPARRGKRVGERMLRWLEALAKEETCDLIVLDSYSYSHAAHKFYHREGFGIIGYHFTKPVSHS